MFWLAFRSHSSNHLIRSAIIGLLMNASAQNEKVHCRSLLVFTFSSGEFFCSKGSLLKVYFIYFGVTSRILSCRIKSVNP